MQDEARRDAAHILRPSAWTFRFGHLYILNASLDMEGQSMGPFPQNAPPATIAAENPMGTDGFEFVEFAAFRA